MKIRFFGIVLLLTVIHIVAQGTDTPHSPIRIRVVDGVGQFYNADTDEPFIIRGANFLHLERDGNGFIVDTLFTQFDAEQVVAELRDMRELGYNTLRAAVDICRSDCLTEANGGIRADVLDNIADFLELAHDAGLSVILIANDFPDRSEFVQRMEAQCCDRFDGYMNTHYLSAVGLETWQTYWQTIIQGLIDRDAPMETILAYSLRNEMWFFADQPPLSLTSGTVVTANGITYDLAEPSQRQVMLEEGAVYWLNEMRAAIHEVHPDALVTVGLFTPNEPNNWRGDDPRVVLPLSVLARSELDFFDLHPYPGYLGLDALMENYQVDDLQGQPIILGEFGAFKFHYPTPEAGALGLRDWQIASCAYDFQGWLHWHWTGEDDHEVWTGTEGGHVINNALAPIHRLDPCAVGDYTIALSNLALGSEARASQALNEEPATNLVDGTSAQWGAGGDAPQWVELDFAQSIAVSRVTLRVAQYPEGETQHRVWGILGSGQRVLLHEFNLFTRDDEVLEVSLPTPLPEVQRIRVETLASPSWVAWKEIEVFSEGEGQACVVNAGGPVNLRAEPTTASSIDGALGAGDGAIVVDQLQGDDGFIWYHLTSNTWVREDIVTLSGACESP